MKLVITGMILLGGCFGAKTAVKDFIPGTYVCPIHQEYSIGSDTLVISLLHDNNYAILKNSGFRRIVNGRLLPAQHSSKHWAGLYDGNTRQLVEQLQGRVFSFDVAGNALYSGGNEYKKLP